MGREERVRELLWRGRSLYEIGIVVHDSQNFTGDIGQLGVSGDSVYAQLKSPTPGDAHRRERLVRLRTEGLETSNVEPRQESWSARQARYSVRPALVSRQGRPVSLYTFSRR
jgi:hypothetical protein